MRVRWTTDAADDLERICDYIAESRPESARQVAQSVVERISQLQSFPRISFIVIEQSGPPNPQRNLSEAVHVLELRCLNSLSTQARRSHSSPGD